MAHIVRHVLLDEERVKRKYPPNPQYRKEDEDRRRITAWIRGCQRKKWIAGK